MEVIMEVTVEFERSWENFVSERRLEYGGHTDPQWRGEHETSTAFILPVQARTLDERLEPLRAALWSFPFVSLHPDHFMHISLVFTGFSVEGEANPEDFEITGDRLKEIEAEARDAVRGFGSFPVRLANLNAFPAAAFVEAHDSGEIDALRNILGQGCGLKIKGGPPHLTLAYFHAPDDSKAPDALIEEISKYRDWPVGEIEVREVELSLLDLTSDYPKPRPLANIPLK